MYFKKIIDCKDGTNCIATGFGVRQNESISKLAEFYIKNYKSILKTK
jgi:hypothetical protein